MENQTSATSLVSGRPSHHHHYARNVCFACCGLVVVVAAFVGGTAAMFHHPTLGIQSALIHVDLRMASNAAPNSQALPIELSAALWINNPNGWPFSSRMRDATGNVYSWDAMNRSPPLFIGVAQLANPFDVPAHSHTIFHMILNTTIQATGARGVQTGDGAVPLIQRLTGDCSGFGATTQQGLQQPWGAQGGGATTVLSVQLTEVDITQFGIDQAFRGENLKKMGLDSEQTVPAQCVPALGVVAGAGAPAGTTPPPGVGAPSGTTPPPGAGARALIEVTPGGAVLRKQIDESEDRSDNDEEARGHGHHSHAERKRSNRVQETVGASVLRS